MTIFCNYLNHKNQGDIKAKSLIKDSGGTSIRWKEEEKFQVTKKKNENVHPKHKKIAIFATFMLKS